MVQTRGSLGDHRSGHSDPVAARLDAIAAKLEMIDSLKEDIAILKQLLASRDKASAGNSRSEEGESSHTRAEKRTNLFPPFKHEIKPTPWLSRAVTSQPTVLEAAEEHKNDEKGEDTKTSEEIIKDVGFCKNVHVKIIANNQGSRITPPWVTFIDSDLRTSRFSVRDALIRNQS